MNKRKIVVGENFLHNHQGIEQICVAAGKMPKNHVIVDGGDWAQIVAYFNNPLYPRRVDDLIRQIEHNLVVVSEKPESQKCDQSTDDRPIPLDPANYPLGVIPRIDWMQNRARILQWAISQRSKASSLPIPEDWVKEYNELVLYFNGE